MQALFAQPGNLDRMPDSHTAATLLEPPAFKRGVQALVLDGAWASVVGAWSSGVVLVGFALALGASSVEIGVLAAIPFFAQLAQVPAVGVIERLRRRKLIAVAAITASRVVILGLAIIPWLLGPRPALLALVLGQGLIAALVAFGACAWNSWIHDFLTGAKLGGVFSRRLMLSTAFSLAAGLFASAVTQFSPESARVSVFSLLFFMAAGAGFFSSAWLTQVPAVPMPPPEPTPSTRAALLEPLRDENFRRLIIFMAAWNFANNLAAPFFAVYLIDQLGFSLGSVVLLSVISQLANIATLTIWGPLSDRFANKSILQVAAPISLGAILALALVENPISAPLRVPILVLIHLVMGASSAGIALATGNIGLKLAPVGRATGYLAAIGVIGAMAAGAAPLLGGLLADWFAAREFAIVAEWRTPSGERPLLRLHLRHWQFFFAIAVVIGLYALHRLSLVREQGEVEERIVLNELMLAARRAVRSASSIAGLMASASYPLSGAQSANSDGVAPPKGGDRKAPPAKPASTERTTPARSGPPQPR